MDKNPLISKWLAVGIILLFVGVTIASPINFQVVQASQEDDLVEVTTQACGIKGYRDTTVKLTREQYQNLELYLVEFRARLNQTSTREEAIPFFKEAVMELHKYGLLPKGMSVKRAQRLITGSSSITHIPFYLKQMLSACQAQNNITSNSICLITGQSTLTTFQGIPSILFYTISMNMDVRILSAILYLLSQWADQFREKIPSCFGNRVYIGYSNLISPDVPEYHLSSGWVTTIGLQGLKKTQGDMIGALPISLYLFSYGPFPPWKFYPAISGFIGIKTSVSGKSCSSPEYAYLSSYTYLGSALQVQISSEPPE